jgi:hypothetical protein
MFGRRLLSRWRSLMALMFPSLPERFAQFVLIHITPHSLARCRSVTALSRASGNLAIAKGAVMLLLATKPPRKDLFLKMPRTTLQPLQVEEVRSLMLAEAKVLGVTADNAKLAELQERSGGNPYLAKRVMREEVLGIGEGLEGDHVEYIDGTPFLIAAISLVAIVRFVGLGLGDKSLYIIGGIATVLAITLRVGLMRANSRTGAKL